jgi:transposase
MLRAVDLDGLVAADDSVRDVWRFVEGLDLGKLYAAIEAREGEPGRPAIDPKILMALWLYGTVGGVGSARALEHLCEREIGFQWLCGGVNVNYHTLSDFRVAQGDLLDRLLSESVAVLCGEGLVSLERLSLDGVPIRASAGASSFGRRRSLEACRKPAEQLVRRLKRELQEDPAAGEQGRQAAQRRAAADRLEPVKAALRTMGSRENERRHRQRRHDKQGQQQESQPRDEPRVSTTDPQVRVMKMPDGGYRPAYNGQLIGDPVSNVIVGVDIDPAAPTTAGSPPCCSRCGADTAAPPINCWSMAPWRVPRTSSGQRAQRTGRRQCSWRRPRANTGPTPTSRATGMAPGWRHGGRAWPAPPAKPATSCAVCTSASTPLCENRA